MVSLEETFRAVPSLFRPACRSRGEVSLHAPIHYGRSCRRHLCIHEHYRGRAQAVSVLSAKLDRYFQVKQNVIFEQAIFNHRAFGKSVEQFITNLYNYGDLQNEMIRDRVIVRIQDQGLSEHIQTLADLTSNLDCLPPRVLRFQIRLLCFSYTISHDAGKFLHTADALSRTPVAIPDSTQAAEDSHTEWFIAEIVFLLPANAKCPHKYRTA